MKAPIFRFFCLCFLSFFLVTACSNIPIGKKSESLPLEVAYNQWPGTFPMVIAQEKGFFKEQGVNVKPIYTTNYIDSVSNFISGQADAGFIVLGSLMSLIEQTPDVQILLITDESAGADVILAKPNIQNIADLKGKRIGVKLGDYGELFVSRLLEKQGLNLTDVTLVNLEGEDIPQNFQAQTIEAGQTWEPYVSQSLKVGAKVLATSDSTPGLMPTVMVFRNKIIQERPQQIKAFLRAWFQAQDHWKAHPEESKELIVQALKIKPEDVFTEGIKFYNLLDNVKAFIPGKSSESIYYTAKLYVDFTIQKGGLKARPDISSLINPTFIQELNRES